MEDTSARLLTAARRLFARRGYSGATTREIAREAGVNEVTLFRSFGTKERLLHAAVAASFPAEPLPLATLLGPQERPEDLIRTFAAAFGGIALEAQREAILIAAREGQDHPALLTLLRTRATAVADLLTTHLEPLEERGQLPPGAASALPPLLVQALIGRFVLGDPGDPGELGATLARWAARAPAERAG